MEKRNAPTPSAKRPEFFGRVGRSGKQRQAAARIAWRDKEPPGAQVLGRLRNTGKGFAAGLSRCCREVRTKSVAGESRSERIAGGFPGRRHGLVAKSYFLLFVAFFVAAFFFGDFLAVFLAAAM